LGPIFELSDSMHLTSTLAVAALLGLAAIGPVFAQTVDTGLEVRVNPVPRSGGVLLYPGGEYARSAPTLLYPGERRGPITLRMPTERRSASRAAPPPETPRPEASRTEQVARAPAPAPKPEPKPEPPKRMASAQPPARPPAPSSQPNIFSTPDYSNVFGNAPTPPPVQKTAPAGPSTGKESLSKRSVILFAKDAPDPAASALGALKFLAGDLNAAMTSPGARIELQAFGGPKGDKGSDARRLSLKRALSIRQVLIDDGVSADRIDVRAMGGVDDTGPTDRVDVYVKA
jgi:outer membrane protein OmpA-like peptidoglycan-associated protein